MKDKASWTLVSALILCFIGIIVGVVSGDQDAVVRIKRDSYISAYRDTHDLNEHAGSNPKVVYVDATSGLEDGGHHDVHPVYVHDNHVDHVDVEHHYVEDFGHTQVNAGAVQGSSGFGNYAAPSGPSGSGNTYGVPSSAEYGPPPVGTYGPPIPINPSRKPLQPSYGPPSPVHMPPTLPPVFIPQPPAIYGPPHHKIPPPPLGYYEPEPHFFPDVLQDLIGPHGIIGLLEKFKLFKLDLFTIGKLILKFFIFKKIIAFITILFLLLVIPSLKHKGKESVGMVSSMIDKIGDMAGGNDEDDEDDEEDGRSAKWTFPKRDDINLLTSYVLNAIESFEKKISATSSSSKSPISLSSTTTSTPSPKTSPKNCVGVYCASQSVPSSTTSQKTTSKS